jgi:hypothetical protein
VSAGFKFDDDPSRDALAHWRRIVRLHPKVLHLQRRYLELPSAHSFDVPYLAGYSTKRDRIFFDRHLDYIQTVGRRRLNVNPCIKMHEATESALKDTWNLFSLEMKLPREADYEYCHDIATAVEYQAVEGLDVKLKDYRDCLRPFMKVAASEKLTKVPRDLDLFPYMEDKKLLSHLEQAMKNDPTRRLGFRKVSA